MTACYRKVALPASSNLAVFEVPRLQGHRDDVWIRCYGRHVATKLGGKWLSGGRVPCDAEYSQMLEEVTWANGSNPVDANVAPVA